MNIDKNNWCVKITRDNKEILQSYLNQLYYYKDWSIGAYYGFHNGNQDGSKIKWCEPITTEDFQIYILNHQPTYEIY